MELLEQYIAALNAVIKAGVDVRTSIEGKSVPVIAIAIQEGGHVLELTYLNRESPFDKTAYAPARTKFTVEFNDYPNELRTIGWE
jgi:hypothetical protein